MRALIASLVIVTLAASCASDGDVDRDAWRFEMETHPDTISLDPEKFAAAQDRWLSNCDLDESGFARVVADAVDFGTSPDQLEIMIRHACPERLVEANELIEVLSE